MRGRPGAVPLRTSLRQGNGKNLCRIPSRLWLGSMLAELRRGRIEKSHNPFRISLTNRRVSTPFAIDWKALRRRQARLVELLFGRWFGDPTQADLAPSVAAAKMWAPCKVDRKASAFITNDRQICSLTVFCPLVRTSGAGARHDSFRHRVDCLDRLADTQILFTLYKNPPIVGCESTIYSCSLRIRKGKSSCETLEPRTQRKIGYDLQPN
jgi:hypothetical protein